MPAGETPSPQVRIINLPIHLEKMKRAGDNQLVSRTTLLTPIT